MKKLTKKPDFLGIGPPKTATSWLFFALSQHPEVSLPPKKEIGYLWEKYFLPQKNFFSRFINNHWYYIARRKYLSNSFKNHIKNLKRLRIDRKKLLWDIHYTIFPHTDSWYSRLFDRQLLSGEVTPKYCELPEIEVAKIYQIHPNLKIIISLRDPVEREWSRAKMNLCKNQNKHPSEIEQYEWIAHFDDPLQSSVNDYKYQGKRKKI